MPSNIIIKKKPVSDIKINRIKEYFKLSHLVINKQAREASNSAEPEKIANKYILPLMFPK
jgi:hypothetical protein